MKKTIVSMLAAIAMFSSSFFAFADEDVFIWPGKKGPGSENVKAELEVVERSSDPAVKNRAVMGITEPYYTVFKAENSNGAGIVICPGGAYARVTVDIEGADIAKAYNAAGYTVFVLAYRLPCDGHENASLVPLQDAQRALRMIRSRASEYGISPDKIGIMGFSAGGHVAASLGTRYDEKAYEPKDDIDSISARPDFMILIYPVITMLDPYAHKGSRKALLGEKPKKKDMKAASCELLVTEDTPKSFIACAANDGSVPPAGNAFAFYNALLEKKVPAEIHTFNEKNHGFGLQKIKGSEIGWQNISITWLDCYVK